MTEYLDVDVRPILASGGEPFSMIMAAVASVQPGQGIRLYAPFKPVPLFDVMASKGFAHSEQEIGGGDSARRDCGPGADGPRRDEAVGTMELVPPRRSTKSDTTEAATNPQPRPRSRINHHVTNLPLS